MTWTARYVTEGDYVLAELEGRFSSRDHRAMIEDIVNRDFWKPGRSILLDNRKLTFPEPAFSEVMAASENHVEFDAQIGNGKAANLMDGDAGFGTGRQYQNMVGDQVAAQIRIFTDEAEAIAWLTGKAA